MNHNTHYSLLILWLPCVHLISARGQFRFQYCENAIVTDRYKEPEIILWCQSTEEYKYCKTGRINNNEQEVSKYCRFSKYSWSTNGNKLLKTEECNPENFKLHIWQYGIVQSALDCKLQLTPYQNKGEHFSSKWKP